MSEVEKMYENAGIKPVIRDNAIDKGCYIQHQRIEVYPPFTAEKQLELIKLLAHKRNGFLLLAPTTDRNKFSTATDFYYGSFRTTVARLFKGIDETIAGLLNIIWQDLTESEQEQIRSILNG